MRAERNLLNERGFTLIEVMASLVLTGIVLAIVTSIAAGGYLDSRKVITNMEARLVASHLAESLYFADPSDSRLAAGNHELVCSDQACPDPMGTTRARWTVTLDSPTVGTMEILIVVERAAGDETTYARSVVYRSMP